MAGFGSLCKSSEAVGGGGDGIYEGKVDVVMAARETCSAADGVTSACGGGLWEGEADVVGCAVTDA